MYTVQAVHFTFLHPCEDFSLLLIQNAGKKEEKIHLSNLTFYIDTYFKLFVLFQMISGEH